MRHVPLPLVSTVLAAVATAVLGTAASPAWAHTRLVSSTPQAGASAEAPGEVLLVFDDPVQPGLSAVSVTGANGEEHVAGTPSAGGDGSSVTQPLRAPLGPGPYRVAYRVLAADGHPVTGSFAFVAGTAAGSAAPSASPPTTTTTTTTPTTPSPAPTTGAVQTAAGSGAEDGGLPVLPLTVGGLVVAGAAGLLARRLGGAPTEA